MPMIELDGFLFDLDGTVYLGEHALPGAAETIACLRTRGKKVLFVSNKPLEPRETYANKLTRLGIPASPDEVITSAFVLGRYLALHEPSLRYYVLGEDNLLKELQEQGLLMAAERMEQDAREVIDPIAIDAVIVAFDRTLTYRKLNTAYQALRRGARYFATNADNTCPMPGGDIPDAGATIAALAQLTGRTPEVTAGKPSSLIVEIALEQMGLPAHRCLVTGDRLETDIRMGHEAGMKTAVVLTGVTSRAQATQGEPSPDLVLEDLGQLLAWVA